MKFQYIKDKVSAYFTKGNERSVAVKKNIAVSLVLKCIRSEERRVGKEF